MKRAFTLIELLVVIAIIAILAAILFPVFAQAKEAAKKTASLSNFKQTATSVAIYQGDADDNMPSAYSVDDGIPGHAYGIAGQALAFGGVVPAGSGWVTTIPEGADDPAYAQIDSQSWINSTQPYRKSYDITTLNGGTKTEAYGSPPPPWIKTPAQVSMTMNGLLSTYNVTAIAAPSRTPLFWAGSAKYNFNGGAWHNPNLQCTNTAVNPAPACRFNASGPPQTTAPNNRGDGVWTYAIGFHIYGKGWPVSYSDTSAKFVQIGKGGNPNSPFLRLNDNGSVAAVYRCHVGTGPDYLAWFRPDLENYIPGTVTGEECRTQ